MKTGLAHKILGTLKMATVVFALGVTGMGLSGGAHATADPMPGATFGMLSAPAFAVTAMPATESNTGVAGNDLAAGNSPGATATPVADTAGPGAAMTLSPRVIVPEPTPLLMLLGGIGMIAFIARRRIDNFER